MGQLTDAPAFLRVGVDAAAEAAALTPVLHLPHRRDERRALLMVAKAALEGALEEAFDTAPETAGDAALAAGSDPVAQSDVVWAEHSSTRGRTSDGSISSGGHPRPAPAWAAACREALLRVYGTFAEDARYGAGQLSRAAQRAPSAADCEDGWQRVQEIVSGAEEVARKAHAVTNEHDPVAVRKLAADALRAARAARAIVEGRNFAYTFHANPAFSFGEGWYAAAAAVLGGVPLQVEPEQKHTAAAERFLRDAGLGAHLRAYRTRPRANKALPLIVADAFGNDPMLAQTRLRAAFLGDSAVVARVQAWLAARLPGALGGPTVLVWNRQSEAHDAHRNSSPEELTLLSELAKAAELRPILIGDGLGALALPAGSLDLSLFWKDPLFQGLEMRRAQLELFERLRSDYGLVGQVGVTTAGMDGPALLGLPTLYLTDQPNVRLGRWVSVVPGYEEVIRDGNHASRIRTRLEQWRKHHVASSVQNE